MAPGRPLPPPPPIIWVMALIFVAFELVFQMSDTGVVFGKGLRLEVYYIGAFWDLYFEAWREGQAVPVEFWASFVTHGFLHGSMVHLVMNGVIFLALGGMLANVLGSVRFLVLFAVTAAAGALVFALITDTRGPLVGASGAIFGFFGILKAWECRYLLRHGGSWRRFWGTIIGLAAINLVLFYVLPGGGQLAWEAHLGGFIAGFALGPVVGRGLSGPSPV